MRKLVFGGLAGIAFLIVAAVFSFHNLRQREQRVQRQMDLQVMSESSPAAAVTAPFSGSIPALEIADSSDAGQRARGVAFNYDYAFRLPGERIAAVQEGHAAACEALGAARCRVAGMQYAVGEGGAVSAMLAVKLDPAIARSFGKDGITAVTRADGKLVSSAIVGVDTAAAAENVDRDARRVQAEIRRLEGELARSRNVPELAQQFAAELSRQRSLLNELRADGERSANALTATPMRFTYAASAAVAKPEAKGALSAALTTAGESFIGGVGSLIIILSATAPWAALLGIGWLVWMAVQPVLARRRLSAPAIAEA
ncbi:DUF4349 domain-containing protein [Sphingomonas sanxanigenens]|uniref:DUF4349 domain-containing protein n=1 Tax=Sphingomonas sanxanigenens DSM 19645 = NX02 TaxID=1123269 RepID=W0ALC0_9SPHN|nr:DUF4349 domain-containing protein [Sphingomonas sanxanigenens]AHE57093.1 hypothetical protein NX02_27545 [Sphingomonas sanxanigenens DSM 19645 = NX02]